MCLCQNKIGADREGELVCLWHTCACAWYVWCVCVRPLLNRLKVFVCRSDIAAATDSNRLYSKTQMKMWLHRVSVYSYSAHNRVDTRTAHALPKLSLPVFVHTHTHAQHSIHWWKRKIRCARVLFRKRTTKRFYEWIFLNESNRLCRSLFDAHCPYRLTQRNVQFNSISIEFLFEVSKISESRVFN